MGVTQSGMTHLGIYECIMTHPGIYRCITFKSGKKISVASSRLHFGFFTHGSNTSTLRIRNFKHGEWWWMVKKASHVKGDLTTLVRPLLHHCEVYTTHCIGTCVVRHLWSVNQTLLLCTYPKGLKQDYSSPLLMLASKNTQSISW